MLNSVVVQRRLLTRGFEEREDSKDLDGILKPPKSLSQVVKYSQEDAQ